MLKRPILSILLSALFFAPSVTQAEVPVISVEQAAASLSQYETLEINITVNAEFTNPYDAKEIDLFLEITTPGGKKHAMPAFFYVKDGIWKARYTPTENGKYTYTAGIITPSIKYVSPSFTLTVSPGKKDGFLRKSTNNPYYLTFDSGKPFFGIGHNISWVTDNDLSIYEKYFQDLKNAGCNMTRVWINCPWSFYLENERTCAYNASDCDKLDGLLALAEKYGIYLVLVLDTYGSIKEDAGDWNEGSWDKNPYNTVNGGPCNKPWDFFTDAEAKEIYKNRLRYIVARYSHSANILTFELWNEVNTPPDWEKEMTEYFKSINPHGQLLTSSLGFPWGDTLNESLIWSIPNVDLIQHHIWGENARDITGYLISVNTELRKKYGKPFFTGEFAMSSAQDDKYLDEKGHGAALHNSIWASAFTGSFSGAMNWWWAGYVRAKNLYPHYKALNKFLSGVNWDSKKIEFLDLPKIEQKTTKYQKPTFTDVSISMTKKWGDTSYEEFSIKNNGDLEGGFPNYYLHGNLHRDLKLNPLFRVNYQKEGKFVIYIDKVSQGAKMTAFLDGYRILYADFPAGPGKGPWKNSTYRKEYGIYQCDYGTTIELYIPKGQHEIRLINSGEDWLGIKAIKLTNYKNSKYADARALAFNVDSIIYLWIQNKAYNWIELKNGLLPQTIKNATLNVPVPVSGQYELEWWDTFKGECISKEKINSSNGTLHILIPGFDKDIACKIKRSK